MHLQALKHVIYFLRFLPQFPFDNKIVKIISVSLLSANPNIVVKRIYISSHHDETDYFSPLVQTLSVEQFRIINSQSNFKILQQLQCLKSKWYSWCKNNDVFLLTPKVYFYLHQRCI